MRKDIPIPEVKDIALAVINEINEEGESNWYVYLLNLKDVLIEGVLISSRGYGFINDEEVKTSMLRHFLDTVPANSFMKIEKIMEDVFGLTNEYWVSFYIDGLMYDKKYIFLPETITETYFTTVPLINRKGVMIK